MPSAINYGGVFSRRPGVYAKIDASALEFNTLTTNRVAIIADMPFLQQGVAEVTATQNALKNVEHSSEFLKLAAKILYNAANDSKVTGSPASVTLVSPNPSTQAFINLASGSTSMLKVSSRSWGDVGNRASIRVARSSTDASADAYKLRDIIIQRDGVSEKFTKVGSGDVLKLSYTESFADSVSATYTRASGLAVAQTAKAVTLGLQKTGVGSAAWASSASLDYILKGTITAKLYTDSGATAAQGEGTTTDETTVVFVGFDSAGAAATETLTFNGISGTSQTTTTVWSSITTVTQTNGSAVTGEYWTDLVFNYVVGASDHTNASGLVTEFANHVSKGFAVSLNEPSGAEIPWDQMDGSGALDIKTAAKYLRGDLYTTQQHLYTFSELVTAAEISGVVGGTLDETNSVTAGDETTGFEPLTSGSQTATASLSDAHWQTAIDALRPSIDPVSGAKVDVQTIVLMNTASSVQTALRTHCNYMAGAGKNECNAWVGMPSLSTLAATSTRSKALNTRHLSLVFQDVQITSPAGKTVWLNPAYTALMMAGIQNSTATGVPMTRKYVNALNVRQNTAITLQDDIETLLEDAVVALMPASLGYRVERSTTTYLTSDNLAFAEVSANESINTSIRDLRSYLDKVIGDANVATTKIRIDSIVKSRLRQQVTDGIIKAFDETSVDTQDLGDKFNIRFVAAPTLPVNFILIETVFVPTLS